MKNKIAIVVSILVVIALIAAFFLTKNKKNAKEGQYSKAEAVMTDLSEYVEVTGYVAPQNRVEITPASSGRIEKILVNEGTKIKEGQVLAYMSSSDRVAILDSARSMSAEDLQYWQDAYKPIKVVSPLNGTIILKNIVEGQTVGSGTVLFAISDKLIVKTTVDESDIGKIKVGQKARITLDAYPDTEIGGTVFQILDEGATVNNVITYVVKIRPDYVPAFYKSEMTANVKVRISADRKALLVPTSSVILNDSGSTAVIVSVENEKPVYKDVKIGVMNGDNTEIVSGLQEGNIVYSRSSAYVPQKAEQTGSNPLMPNRPKKSNSTSSSTDTVKRAKK